jgi:hypothetical protein
MNSMRKKIEAKHRGLCVVFGGTEGRGFDFRVKWVTKSCIVKRKRS